MIGFVNWKLSDFEICGCLYFRVMCVLVLWKKKIVLFFWIIKLRMFIYKEMDSVVLLFML